MVVFGHILGDDNFDRKGFELVLMLPLMGKFGLRGIAGGKIFVGDCRTNVIGPPLFSGALPPSGVKVPDAVPVPLANGLKCIGSLLYRTGVVDPDVIVPVPIIDGAAGFVFEKCAVQFFCFSMSSRLLNFRSGFSGLLLFGELPLRTDLPPVVVAVARS